MDEQQQAQFNGWARVEVMGHQTHIGFVKTEAYGGSVLFRIDTPPLPEREYVLQEPAYVDEGDGCQSWQRKGATVRRLATEGVSVLVGAGSIYRIVPCTEQAALKAIEAGTRSVLKLVSAPPDRALPEATSGDEAIDDDGDDDGFYDEDELEEEKVLRG